MKKGILVVVLICLLSIGGIYYFTMGGYSSDHICDWCYNHPTKEYKISDNEISYICKECSRRCMYCGDKATGHAPNYYNMMVFYCKNCYDSM